MVETSCGFFLRLNNLELGLAKIDNRSVTWGLGHYFMRKGDATNLQDKIPNLNPSFLANWPSSAICRY